MFILQTINQIDIERRRYQRRDGSPQAKSISNGFFSILSIIAFCSSLGNSAIIARILPYTSFLVFLCWGSLLGHWSFQCPVFLHLKQAPFLINSARSFIVMESMSMAFGSCSFFAGNWNLRFVWLIV